MAPIDEAEICSPSGWRRIGILDALSEPKGTVLRCPSCGGRVRPHREGTTGQCAHFEHYQRHDGCPTKPGFKGPATRHLHALD